MSELNVAADVAAAPGPSAGSLIRQAREAAGIHVAALAVALKVPVSKLEALEADRLDQLPDAVFVRALASSICRHLRIDPAAVLKLLPQTVGPRLAVQDGGLNAPFRAPHQRRSGLLPEHWFSPTLLAVPLLFIGAAVLYLWPHFKGESVEKGAAVVEPQTAVISSVEAIQAPAPADISAPPPFAAPERSESTPSGVSATPSIPPAPIKVEPPPSVSAPAAAVVTEQSSSSQDMAVTEAIISFSASGMSWIKVTDSQGKVTLQKTLAAGETASANGQPPLSVVVGKVDATQVQVRGKTFDLQTVARENVARFEVK